MQLKPIYGEDYQVHWGYTSYKDRTVLDLGADYGSSTEWFLEQGAKFVIAVEGDPTLGSQLVRNFANHKKVYAIALLIQNPGQLTALFREHTKTPKIDVVKMDIEGAETNLLGVPPKVVSRIPEYLIESHSPDIEGGITTFLTGLGFRHLMVYSLGLIAFPLPFGVPVPHVVTHYWRPA